MCAPRVAALLAAAAPLGAAAQGASAASASPMATAVSILVLGGIGFQVLLLYLLTVSSKSTQRHTWQLVRHAVAVTFSALLLRTVHDMLVGTPQGVGEIMCDMVLLVASLSLMELGLSGLHGGGGGNGGGRELAQQAKLRTWGLLCSRLAGLAAARGWGSWQGALLWGSPWLSLLAVPAALLVLQMMYQGFSGLRGGDTGVPSPSVVSEREVMALSSSFLLAQALHFALLGGLPDQDGGPGEVWQGSLSFGCLAALAMLAGGALLGFLGIWALERAASHEADTSLGTGLLANMMGFGGAWCVLDGARLIALMLGAPLQEDNLVSVLLALLVSALVFSLLPLLQSLTSRGVSSKPEELVSWLAVLLGMSLAPCMRQTVGVVASSVLPFCPAATGQLIAVLVLGALLLPAWRGPVLRAELALPAAAAAAAPARKADLLELEANAQLLVSMLLSPDTDESELDVAHLKVKDIFRRAYAKPPPPTGAGLTRVRVTARGIEEVHDVQGPVPRPSQMVPPPRAQADSDLPGPPMAQTPPQGATSRLLEASSPPPPLAPTEPRAATHLSTISPGTSTLQEGMPATTMANSVIGGTTGSALPTSILVTNLPGSMNSESPGSLPATPSSEGRRSVAKNRQTPLPWSSASPPGKSFSPQEPLRNRQLRENLEGLHGAVRATLAAGRGSAELAPPEHGAWRSLGSGRSPTPPRLH